MKPIFVSLQLIATAALAACTLLISTGKYLEAGVMGFLGIVAYIVYEYLPEAPKTPIQS